jgi:hypothetical protein
VRKACLVVMLLMPKERVRLKLGTLRVGCRQRVDPQQILARPQRRMKLAMARLITGRRIRAAPTRLASMATKCTPTQTHGIQQDPR